MELRLDNNLLLELPESIGQLTLLKLLHLNDNPTLKILPQTMGGLISLHHILMANCGISTLPFSMKNCLALEFIVADEEILIDPPASVWCQMNGEILRNYLLKRHYEE